jgi:hypothetical protein
MKKQTAVEWIHEQLTSTWFDGKSSREILEIAKYKEREQIADAHREGAWFYAVKTYESGHNYYEETYGKK